jgi:hypothetical protein
VTILNPHVTAKIHFFRTDEGGRQGPILRPWRGCLFKIGNDYHDCIIALPDSGRIDLGSVLVLQLQFLDPKLVLPKLRPGTNFQLKELRIIAEGEIIEVSQADK